jgi:Tol biopolymer transport system component
MMGPVIRRALGAATAALLLLAATAAMAAAPQGPRLAVFKASEKGLELVSVNRNGGRPLRLAGGGRSARPYLSFFSPLSWSADGGTLAFSGIVRFEKGDDHEAIEKIFTVQADGSGLRPVPGTHEALGPVLSPDGRTIAFTRSIDRETPTTVGGERWDEGFHGSSIWTLDLLTGARRQLTPWRDGLTYSASSFSPDGLTLLATYEDPELVSESQPVALALKGGITRRILDDGSEAVYSPDGSKIALFRGVGNRAVSDLFVLDVASRSLRRLTRTPDREEVFASWDPSGERIAFARFPPGHQDWAGSIVQVNADGSCEDEVLTAKRRVVLSGVAWQPGPGREAGRIRC